MKSTVYYNQQNESMLLILLLLGLDKYYNLKNQEIIQKKIGKSIVPVLHLYLEREALTYAKNWRDLLESV